MVSRYQRGNLLWLNEDVTFQDDHHESFAWLNEWQLAKMKKSIPDMSLP